MTSALEKRLYKHAPILRGVVEDNQIRVWCPYCDKHHFHGWPEGFGYKPANVGAHCTNKNSPFYRGGGYQIAPFRKKDKVNYK